MKHYIQTLEETLLSEAVRKSTAQLNMLLADDFLEHGASGNIYDKQSILKTLPKTEHQEMTIETFQIITEADETVVCAYQLLVKNKFDSNRSSVWIKNGDGWQLRFHQGTLV